MGKCLVTTLAENVTDDTLLKLGDFDFYISNSAPTAHFVVRFKTADSSEIKILGDGYFTNSTGASNLGKTKTIVGNTLTDVYFSRGNYRVVLNSKYNLQEFRFPESSTTDQNKVELNINDFFGANNLVAISLSNQRNVYGDLKLLPATQISLAYTNIDGDISCFNGRNDLVNINVLGVKKIVGDISNLGDMVAGNIWALTGTSIYGDLSSLSNCHTITSLQVANPNITGELTDLLHMTNLNTLVLSNTQVTGDTSDLAPLTNLTTFTYTNTAITGTWPLT